MTTARATTSATLDELLSAFPEVTTKGGRHLGPCPLCGGKGKLSIFRGSKGTYKLHCYKCGDDAGLWAEYTARMSTGHVTVRPHVEPAKEPPKPWRGPRNGQTIVARYDYTDALGRSTGTKLRIEPGQGGRSKDFIWLHGANLLGRPSSARHLYRRKELAERPQALIFIVEGEKCVHALQAALDAAGLDSLATCPSDGSPSRPTPYRGQLTGRRVILLPDNDAPGTAFAERWQAAFATEAASFTVHHLDGLSEGNDIVEWLQAGNDVRTLLPATPPPADAPPSWLTDAPLPDDPGVWDSADADYAPAVERQHHPEVAYRLAATGQAYVLTDGVWEPHHRDALWQWAYEQNHLLDGKERMAAATYHAKTVPRAFGIDMDCTTCEPVVLRSDRPHLNTYRGILAPAPAGTAPDFPTIADHLNFMFGPGSDEQEWMLDWLAKWYTPLVTGRGFFRTQVMPLLYGTTGTGKGLLIRLLKRIVGARHTIKVKGTSLDDKFSAAGLSTALLYVIDELDDPQTLDVLKTFITEDDPSKRDMRAQEANFTPRFNMLATSNRIRPIQLDGNDRRITVIRMNEHMPKDLARRIVAHERQGYPELPAFLRFLVDRPVRHGEPMDPLDNAARAALVTLSKPPHLEFLEDVRDLGIRSLVADYFDANPNLKNTDRWHTNPTAGLASIHVAIFAAAYTHWCRQRGKRAIDVSLVISELATVIPTAVATGADGKRGVVCKIAGEAKRCIAGLPYEAPRAPAEPAALSEWQ